MDYKTYEGVRWKIIYGRYDGVEKYTLNELYKVIQQHVPYILTVESDMITEDEIKDFNLVFVGTVKSNRYVRELSEKGVTVLNPAKEGYTIKVCTSTFNSERKMAVLSGMDANGVLYAVRDFEHYYVDRSRFLGYHYNVVHRPFLDEMPDFEQISSPAIEYRGLWSWGHCIYDYRRYIDNMSRWKMNTVILWNDFAPINAKDVVEYAHSRGMKVIWGFSWCWGEEVNPLDELELVKWTQRVLNTYEEQYGHLGGDGIYFQTFTETKDTTIQGESIAKLVTGWVNHVACKLFEKHPHLWIQFGIHATSIKSELMELSHIDPRINITWEDVGSFPYAYDPGIDDKFDETMEYTDQISCLRGENEDFGAVFKGFTVLNWPQFEHQKGVFVLGESNRHYSESRKREKEFYWRYAQPYWTNGIERLQKLTKRICEKKIKCRIITALVEDGMWEEQTWYPVALLAEVLWNPYEQKEEVIRKVSHTRDAYLI